MCQLYGYKADRITEQNRRIIEETFTKIPEDYRCAVRELVLTQSTAVKAAIQYNLSAATIGRMVHKYYIELDKLMSLCG